MFTIRLSATDTTIDGVSVTATKQELGNAIKSHLGLNS